MSWFLTFCNVTFINLILSGDNALAISMSASKLPPKVRKSAIIWGSVIAIVLLILFVALGTYVIKLPILRTVAGVVLLIVAIHLARENFPSEEEQGESNQVQGTKVWKAIRMIAVADLMMSLDNAVAMLGASNGKMSILLPSLLVSIPFLIFGSHFIALVLRKLPFIVYLAATYIAWVAGGMIAEDPIMQHLPWNELLGWIAPIASVVVYGVVIAIAFMRHRAKSRMHAVT